MIKKVKKLIKGGNEQVRVSMKRGVKVGDYIGSAPAYHNEAGFGQPADFVKVVAGVPFVKPELHGL